MATSVQMRRGSTGQISSFTGLLGECVVNTTTKTLVVNDGETAGGIPLARADFDNISASATLTLGTLSATQVDITAQGDLRLQDTTGGEYAALQAPGTVSASYTLTMPSAVGASGQALRASDGAGVLEWYTPADVGDITSVVAGAGLTGGGTSGAVTLNAIGTADRVSVSADAIDIASGYVGQTSITTLGTIASGTWQASIIADAYINNALTISGGTVDNSVIGGTTPAAITATQVDITATGDLRLQDTSGGEYAALQAPGTVSASYTLTMPGAVGSSGQALRASDGAGALEWFTPADVGDITSVVAGAGLTGGGTSGDVTLNAIGTADRITVTADAIDIAATYAGQATITTVGTIASGTWQGTAVAKTYVAGSPSGDYVGTSDSQTLTNKTLTTPVIGTISNTGSLTLPTSTDTLVGRATTDTLTNKTLTTPVIGTISNTGSLTLPTSTDTLVGRATTDTLTNKTLTSPVLNGSLSGTGFLDENDLVSNSQVAAASQASIKTYVDSVASGLDLLDSVHVASTAALTVTYANGSSGVGATLTNAGTQAALVIDGQTLVATERVLIKDQAAALQNGIYTVTNVGSGSSNWVLTRSTDFDTGAELDSGSFVFVETGTTNADSGYVMTTDGTITIGTTAINWTQFSKAADILAGDGLTKTGSTIDAIGTSNRISVNGNIDIDSSYVGQASITTLGTIGSGIWQGTAIADTYVTDALTISGGTINNSVIGGTTPAAITATTLSAGATTITSLTGTDDISVTKSGALIIAGTSSAAGELAAVRAVNNSGTLVQLLHYGSTKAAYGALSSGGASVYSNAAELVLMADNAAGVMKFTTGGNAERLSISAAGDATFAKAVGIGGMAPGIRDLVVNNTAGQSDLAIRSANDQSAQLLFGDQGADNQGIVQYNNSTDSMHLFTNGGEAVAINSDGDVGIGDTADDARLQVFGSTFVGDAASNATIDNNLTGGGLDVAVGSGTKAFQVWDDGSTGTPRFLVERSGNVGIGVASPNANSKLEVDGRVRIGAGSVALPALTGSADYDTGVWWGGSDILGFSTAGVERMRIDSGGDVTIEKSTAPTLVLRRSDSDIVDGENIGTIAFRGDDPSDSAGALIQAKAKGTWAANNYPTSIIFYNDDGAGNLTNRMEITEDGNVGIGTDPGLTRFNVLHDVANWTGIFKNTAANAYGVNIDLSGASGAGGQANIFALAVDTPVGTGFHVLKGGNVGVGTSVPSDKLTVSRTSTDQLEGVVLENLQTGGYGTGITWNSRRSDIAATQNAGRIYVAGENNWSSDALASSAMYFQLRSANSVGTKLTISAAGTFTGSASNDISDQRLKENIETITDPLTKVKALTGRTFNWKKESGQASGVKYGFIAQEVESVISDLVHDKSGIIKIKPDNSINQAPMPEDEGEYAKSVQSTGIIPILVEAIKELSAKIETLEAKVKALEGK